MTRLFFARAPEGALRLFALALGVLTGACQYDLDKLYEHEVPDAGHDASVAEVPAELSSLWLGQTYSTVNDKCQACAKSNCESVNKSCRDDPTCVEFTRCVAQSTDPNTQAQCRSQYIDWLAKDVNGRDVGGPYAQCLFQDTCSTQCGSRTNWECVNEFSWPTTNEQKIKFHFRFSDALNNNAVAGATIKACRPDDLQCTMPVASGKTDSDGQVYLEVPTALRTFEGYFEITGADLYPTLLRLGYPLVYDGVTNFTLISQTAYMLNTEVVGVNPDPTRGLLQFRVSACAGIGSPGVSLSSDKTDSKSIYWYAGDDAVPDLTATATGSLGAGGVIDAPAGRHILTGKLANGKVVSTASSPVRAGHISIVVMVPLDTGN